MKSMPYALKQKLRQYNNAVKRANEVHEDIVRELERHGVPYDNLCANDSPYSREPNTEALAFITNNEGDIEENIADIEEVFLYFVNK